MKKLKFILKNMFSEKWRILLNILAVAIAGSVFYISFIISTTLTDTYTVINRNTAGDSDIQISSSDSYQSIKDELADDGYQHVVEEIYISGVYRNDSMTYWYNVHSLNPDDINRISNVKIKKSYSGFKGKEAIIGRSMAYMFNLSVGDEIELSLNGKRIHLKSMILQKKVVFFQKR